MWGSEYIKTLNKVVTTGVGEIVIAKGTGNYRLMQTGCGHLKVHPVFSIGLNGEGFIITKIIASCILSRGAPNQTAEEIANPVKTGKP